MLKLIILDRDGVINEDSDNYIRSCDEWHAIDGSIEAMVKLQQYGYQIAIATNQSGLARKYFNMQELNLIHNKMIASIKQAGGEINRQNIFICPHKPEDNCACRKPKPGLLIQAANYFNVNPQQILLVGDAERDILAAKAFGVRSALVTTGKGQLTLEQGGIGNIPVYKNLHTLVNALIEGLWN